MGRSGEDVKQFILFIQEYEVDGLPHMELVAEGELDLGRAILFIEAWVAAQKKAYIGDFFKE